MKQIKAKDLQPGDKFVLRLDLSNRKPKIVESVDSSVKYYEAHDTGKYKKLRQIDLKETVYLIENYQTT